MRVTTTGWITRLVALGAVGVAAVGGTTAIGAASASGTIAPFSASAAATGAAIEVNDPGAVLSDQVVDVSGPKAQVAVNTIGASTGFAALPDPGDVVRGAPGFATGLLGLGLAGLPPIRLPTLPSYPLDVSSNAQNNPDASVGAGPYALSAHSTPTSSNASATGGVVSPLTGNIAALQSTASLESSTDSVVATATSTLEGLSIGPLTLGKVTATATETRGLDGTVTPTSSLEISGAAIGGIAVGLGPKGLIAAGQKINLPLQATLDKLLHGAGVKTHIEPAKTFAHRVIAPTLVITMPLPVKLGVTTGTMSLSTASATASLVGTAGGLGPLTNPTSTSPGTSIATTPSTIGGSTPGGLGGSGLPGTGALSNPGGLTGQPPVTAPTPATVPPGGIRTVALSQSFDVRSVYLLLGLVAAILLGAAPLYQLLRGFRWTSGD